MDEPRLLHAGANGKGEFTFDIASTAVPVIAAHLMECLQKAGATNYIATEFRPKLGTGEAFEVIVQRVKGQTPAQQNAQLRQEIAQLREALIAVDQAIFNDAQTIKCAGEVRAMIRAALSAPP